MTTNPLRLILVLILLDAWLLLGGCGGGSSPGVSDLTEVPAVGPWNAGVELPAEPQAGGDPVRGRDLLLHGSYMTCGIPHKLWNDRTLGLGSLIAVGFGGSADAPRIPDRKGLNADLPYFLNTFETEDGVQVVNANCLMCHGGQFDGKLVVGLGNANADFTRGAGGGVSAPLPPAVLDSLGLSEGEKREFQKMLARGAVLGPDTKMRTVGMNPAEMFAVILMVHHVRDTLAWSDEPVTPLVVKDRDGNPIPDATVTSDPPPWWRAHKKNALFYNGMARGDHRGTMALATSVCVDSIERARVVDEMFRDIQAYVASIRAPEYPRAIDTDLAETGHRLFLQNCAGCHGTYAERDEDETYPNLLIPLDVIGTDPVVAEAGVVHAPELVDWYNGSFYGQITRMEPNDPFPGYMPPPLDGIWATAPYLHNGSVPTVELMLNSRARPRYWRRVDLDSRNFDEEALGWPHIALDTPQAEAPESERRFIYDTSYWSQSNAGHTFGDHLTPDERRAVIEYLKTL
jgi:mono/diheme cytochrome c family protein